MRRGWLCLALVGAAAGLVGCGSSHGNPAVCGNGKVETGEDCDDGPQNGQPGVGCSRDCTYVDLTHTSLKVTWKINYMAASGFSDEACPTVIWPQGQLGLDVYARITLAGPTSRTDEHSCDQVQATYVDQPGQPLPAGSYLVTARLVEHDRAGTMIMDLTDDVSMMATVVDQAAAEVLLDFPITTFHHDYTGTLFFQTGDWVEAATGDAGADGPVVSSCATAGVDRVRLWLRRNGQLVPGLVASCGSGCSVRLDGTADAPCHTPTGPTDAYQVGDVPWGPYELVVGGYGQGGLLFCGGSNIFVGAGANPTYRLATAAATGPNCP